VINVVKAAFVQGRLTRDELHARVDQTFASRTYAELAAVTADLPAGLARPEPVRGPARGEGERPVARPGPVISVATGLYTGVWSLALLVPWPQGVESRGCLARSGGGSRGWNATLCDVGIEARRADHYEDLRLGAACDREAVLDIAWQEHESPRCGRPPLACAVAGHSAR
jgi:hypothetical protein